MKEEKKTFARIDLSKLAPEELPQREISISIKGVEQTFDIHPLNGRGRIAWGGNPKRDPKSAMYEDQAIKTALIYGCDMSEEEAEMLMNEDPHAASAIGDAVWLFTSEYDKQKKAEAEDAKKNSDMAETDTPN